MSKVMLLANDRPGIEVAKYLVAQGDEIVRLYLHEHDRQKFGDEITTASQCSSERIFRANQLKDSAHLEELKKENIDFIITVYWAHLLSEDVIQCADKGTVNFHPALLPVNRGWYPHVHSILDGSPLGVTLHVIDKEPDSGPVWAQKEVVLNEYDTAFTIYNRLQKEIVGLFEETWLQIKSGQVQPIPQDQIKAVYHKKSEVEQLDKVNLENEAKVEEVIRLLRARSFGNKGFAYYEKNGEKVYLNLRLSKSPSFEDDAS